ncbi:MAG: hypothetical protein SVW77_01505 [Candidatus Nanohaloarchaea archaeon]|nr:hypothetical protein [Candidatus Nanohaloarchaea archaeon]
MVWLNPVYVLVDFISGFLLYQFIAGFMFLGAALLVYRKADDNLLTDLWKALGAIGIFFLVLASLLYRGKMTGSSVLLSLGYTVPHLSLFVSFAFLWRMVDSIEMDRWRNGFWAYIVYGAFLTGVGVGEMAPVSVQDGTIVFEDGLFNVLLPYSIFVGLGAVIILSVLTVSRTEGEDRWRSGMALVGAVSLAALGLFHMIGITPLGDIATLLCVAAFTAIGYRETVNRYLGRT